MANPIDAQDSPGHDIASKLQAVNQRIAAACESAGRAADDVQLLAVSKTKPASDVQAALAAGQRHFGENYLQDALSKIEELGQEPIWHFIGAIQSNKTRAIAEHFAWVHTVSSLKIARRLNDQRPLELPPLKIFLQINIDDDPAKAGLTPAQLPELIAELEHMPRLEVQGLMTLPTQRDTFEAQRQPFRQLKQLLEHNLPNHSGLSMGMSGDLEAAITEGATWVRIGTDIFGARNQP